jgi:YHS domain-containing protein
LLVDGGGAVQESRPMPGPFRRDPICGREVAIDGATPSCLYRGEIWYFCSRPCQVVFEAFSSQSVEIARREADRRRGADQAEEGPRDRKGR